VVGEAAPKYGEVIEMSEMDAAVMHGIGDIRIERVPVPVPGPREALVRVTTIGICGSDLHYYTEGRIGRYVVEKPLILGHECAGEIVAIGPDVYRIRVGQRVAVEPGATCGECEYCKSGRYNLCPDVRFLATPPVDGAFCEYIVMREDLLYPLPERMSDVEGAMIEPLSAGIQACLRARIRPGDSAIVTGAGPIGLLAMVAARHFGADPVVVFDLEENRLDAARRMGAAAALNVQAQDCEASARRILGRGASVGIEASGSGDALRLAFKLLGRGGRLAIIGLPSQPQIPIDVTAIVDGEIDVHGIFRYANTYPLAISMFSEDRPDLTPMLTAHFPLKEVKAAMDLAIRDKRHHIKILIETAPERARG
jgi:L-iditol 2-dehydrogenase